MTSPQTPKYISAEDLASLLKAVPASSSSSPSPVQVVDVRDDDFKGGNIVGMMRAPSQDASPAGFDKLAGELKGKDKVVFHCALSQVRGPKAARRYAEALDRVDPSSSQEIYILSEGFTGWQARYKNDPTLTEKYIKALWQ